ncbi:hypothetical protein K488DRAFT_84287 [Vararia minispora EC-137]|uniref:Uncharacterized protein n=1 Tax=Vararia minispora EC-137 TaxID=1314806 RepID=A0ACB8QR84_9AGAM|nr:hypothetical protein K488DRAFT_84287 [Vararia minispora EC-137]
MLRSHLYRTVAQGIIHTHVSRSCSFVPFRHISTTSRRHAQTPPNADDFMKMVARSNAFKRISRNEEALQSLKNSVVYARSGIDFTGGKMPSQFQMARLAFNRKFMRALKTCMEEFQKAGMDLKDSNVMEEMMKEFQREAEKKRIEEGGSL